MSVSGNGAAAVSGVDPPVVGGTKRNESQAGRYRPGRHGLVQVVGEQGPSAATMRPRPAPPKTNTEIVREPTRRFWAVPNIPGVGARPRRARGHPVGSLWRAAWGENPFLRLEEPSETLGQTGLRPRPLRARASPSINRRSLTAPSPHLPVGPVVEIGGLLE